MYADNEPDGTYILQSGGTFVQAFALLTLGGVAPLKCISPKPKQLENALLPMLVTLSGIVIAASE